MKSIRRKRKRRKNRLAVGGDWLRQNVNGNNELKECGKGYKRTRETEETQQNWC